MMRELLPYLIQILPFAPMGVAMTIVASQAQGDGFTPGGMIAAGILCLMSCALVELPYILPRDFGQKKKTPTREGSSNRRRVAHTHHENHIHHNTAA